MNENKVIGIINLITSSILIIMFIYDPRYQIIGILSIWLCVIASINLQYASFDKLKEVFENDTKHKKY
jgi:hypothetical protein